MSHPYSNAAGYIYANEYEAPSDSTHWNVNNNTRPSAENSHYEPYSPLHPKTVEADPRSSDDQGSFDRSHVVRLGKNSYSARAIRRGMNSISTTTTRTSSNFSPFSRVSSLPSRTTSNNSHVNPVKYTPSKRVHAPYDPFAYHPGIYDTQDFMHTNDPPEAKSKFSFKFKLTLPRAFQFRTRSQSPTSPSWPPNSPLLNTFAAQRPAIMTTTATNKSLGCPLNIGRGVTLYDDNDNDPSSSHWRWSSFEQRRPSSLSRWFSKTKSKRFPVKPVAPPGPPTYHTPLPNAPQERATFHTKIPGGNLNSDMIQGRPTKGSLRSAQDVVRSRLGPGTGRRAEKDLKFSMVVTS